MPSPGPGTRSTTPAPETRVPGPSRHLAVHVHRWGPCARRHGPPADSDGGSRPGWSGPVARDRRRPTQISAASDAPAAHDTPRPPRPPRPATPPRTTTPCDRRRPRDLRHRPVSESRSPSILEGRGSPGQVCADATPVAHPRHPATRRATPSSRPLSKPDPSPLDHPSSTAPCVAEGPVHTVVHPSLAQPRGSSPAVLSRPHPAHKRCGQHSCNSVHLVVRPRVCH